MIQFEYINEKGELLARKIEKLLNVDANADNNANNAIVFIGALGICVRKIMPIVNDKHSDPAVVCVDTTGRYVIPVLSGHVGGANDLAHEIASLIGAEAIITTQSDNCGLWALDTMARKYGWVEAFGVNDNDALRYDDDNADPSLREPQDKLGSRQAHNINEEIALFVNGEPTALLFDISDEGTREMMRSLPEHVTVVESADEITAEKFRLAIVVSPFDHIIDEEVRVVQYIPRCVHVGIGLAHQAEPAEGVLSEILNAVSMAGICLESIADFNTIDVKRDEPVVKRLIDDGMTVNFYTAEELGQMDVPNPSEVVSRHVGTASVCEAAAMIHGEILTEKQKGVKWTVATSMDSRVSKRKRIEIVGAGPGDPELISLRGRRLLEQADLILYAGSLVPKELTVCHKPGATVRSSADMNLEEQFAIMKEFYDRGMQVVRLHTGDPCIYGAIQEQMAYFDKYGMPYRITPGISSFLAAAAELQSQFTIPERCQTIILTRGEGRTPTPDREKLHLLAQHQSTMCIFLSASIVEDVQRELLEGGYPPETPVAACYKLTWKDQRIYRGTLQHLAEIVKGNHLTLTTMIVVGDAIDNREGLSKLYDDGFAHLFRTAHHNK